MVTILLATYNGDSYISEQLDSLLSQTYSDFIVYVNDDCSTDSTWDILSSYAHRHPDKIKISRRHKNSGSAKHNFIDMMAKVKDEYVMLCDQDDIWLPDKIDKTLAKMKETEKSYPHMPVLVRTDMRVVDRDLRTINFSYKDAMCSNFNRTGFNHVLIQNTFAGCTAMYNRSLAKLLDRKPEYCIMHDWWLELVAAAFGKIAHVDEPTVLYRQHGGNEIGSKDVRKLSYKINRLLHFKDIKKAINFTYLQAESFLCCYEDILTEKQKSIVRQYCKIPKMGKLFRWRTIYNLGTFKNGFYRNIAYFLFV